MFRGFKEILLSQTEALTCGMVWKRRFYKQREHLIDMRVDTEKREHESSLNPMC